jgi:anti-sigma factor RsiW
MSEANESTPPNPRDPTDPEALIDVVLGKASDEDRAALAARSASDAKIARLYGSLLDVRDAIAADAHERTDPAPRALFDRAGALAARLPRVPSWLDRLKSAVLEPLEQNIERGLSSFAQPALRGAMPSVQSFGGAIWRLDVVCERSSSGLPVLRMQVDGPGESLQGALAILDASSGRVILESKLDEDGTCVATLLDADAAIEVVDVAFHVQGEILSARGVRTR